MKLKIFQPEWLRISLSVLMTLFSVLVSDNFIIQMNWNGKNLTDTFFGNLIIFVFYYIIISLFFSLFKLFRRIL